MRDINDLTDLQLALVQAPLVFGDVKANLANFERLLTQVQAADLVVLPEMFNTGFSMESAAHAEEINGLTTQWLLVQAKQLNAVVCGSLIVRVAEGDYRNRLLWACPDGSLQHYDKRHLFRMVGEHEHYTAGQRQLVVELKGWRIRPLICYDLRFPVWSRDAQNTDLLLYVACWPKVRRSTWNRLLAARAIENQCYVAGVNRIGEDHNGYPHSGDSQALDYLGDPLLLAYEQEGVYHVRLNAQSLARFKQKFPAYMDADDFSISDTD